MLCFLQRNMGACPQKTKELLCKTLVRPVMEYAAIVWDPSTQENIRKVEMVQRRCARFVQGDYRRTSSVSAMLNQLKWASLQERRAQQKVGMVYSILHGLVDLPVTYFIPVVGPSTRGNPQKFHVPFARTLLFQTTFYPDTIRLWYSLPSAVVDCTSLELFKQKVQHIKLRWASDCFLAAHRILVEPFYLHCTLGTWQAQKYDNTPTADCTILEEEEEWVVGFSFDGRSNIICARYNNGGKEINALNWVVRTIFC